LFSSPLPNPDETTDKTTQFWLSAKAQAIMDSHSTKASENDAQVAGYLPQVGEGTIQRGRLVDIYQMVTWRTNLP